MFPPACFELLKLIPMETVVYVVWYVYAVRYVYAVGYVYAIRYVLHAHVDAFPKYHTE
jgi:hypothetical protein